MPRSERRWEQCRSEAPNGSTSRCAATAHRLSSDSSWPARSRPTAREATCLPTRDGVAHLDGRVAELDHRRAELSVAAPGQADPARRKEIGKLDESDTRVVFLHGKG